jgi:hypothetical protein
MSTRSRKIIFLGSRARSVRYDALLWLIIDIHRLINSIWNKEELPDHWKGSFIVPVNMKGAMKMTVEIIWSLTVIILIQNIIQYLSLKVKDLQDRVITKR